MQAPEEKKVALDDIRDRVAEIVKLRHRNINAFCAATGLPRQMIYDIVGGKRNMPTVQTVNRILSAVDEINGLWLLTGKGEMLISNQQSVDTVAYDPQSPISLDLGNNDNSEETTWGVNDVRDRIADLVKLTHGNVNAFSVATGVSKAILYDIIGNRRNKPSIDTVEQILSVFPNLSLVWLLKGDGDMFITDQQPAAPVAPDPQPPVTLAVPAADYQEEIVETPSIPTTVADRISEVMVEKGLTADGLAARIGLTRAAIKDIVSNARSKYPTAEALTKIAEAFPDINSTWLLTGKGSIYVRDNQPATSGVVAKNATTGPAPIILSLEKKPKRSQPTVAKTINLTWSALVRALPGVKASAGTGNINEAITEGQTKMLTIPGLAPSQSGGYLGLFADGDSMQPVLEDGDLIVIDQLMRPEYELRVGHLYVILTKSDESYVKRLSNIDLTNLLFTSDNLQYPALSIPVTEIQSIYRVALRITKGLDLYRPPAMDDILGFYGDRITRLEGRR